MKYRDKTTGDILSSYDVRVKFAETSFPSGTWNQSVLDFANVEEITEVQKPENTEDTVYTYDGVKQVDGIWTDTWISSPRYSAEEQALRDTASAAKAEQDKWVKLRADRDTILNELDKVLIMHRELLELSKRPFSVNGVYSDELYKDILKYKNDLRALPQNTTDINNISWPVSPLATVIDYKTRYMIANSDVSDLNPS